MIDRLFKAIVSRQALILYLVLLQVSYLSRVWPDYEPPLQTRLYCFGRQVSSVRGENVHGKEFIVTARRFSCLFGSRAATNYVYVHYLDGSAEDRSWNIAFSYSGYSPALAVSTDHHLQITFHEPIEIDTQLMQIHGIPINYVVDRQRAPS